LFWRGWIFSEKGKGVFSFGVLPSKYSGSVAGRNADSVLRKLFSGEKDFAKPQLISWWWFPARRKGSGEESARASSKIFLERAKI